MLFIFRCFVFLLGIFYTTALMRVRRQPDHSVMEPLVNQIYLGILIYLIVWPLIFPYVASIKTIRFLLLLELLFCLGMTGLAGFLAVYPYFFPSKMADGTERVMIVLGAPVWNGEPTSLLISRTQLAANYMQKHSDITAVFSGGLKDSVSEAQMMQNLVSQEDITNTILLEDQSLTTDENFLFSKDLLEANGFRITEPIAAATNAFHFYRLRNYAKRCGYTSIRFLIAPTPASTAWMWDFREAIVTIRWWLLKK